MTRSVATSVIDRVHSNDMQPASIRLRAVVYLRAVAGTAAIRLRLLTAGLGRLGDKAATYSVNVAVQHLVQQR